MQTALTTLTTQDILIYLTSGVLLGALYFMLLWQTISILPRVKKKALVITLSTALRVFLLIFVALVLAQNNMGRFLLIFIGFILTRMIFLYFAKPSLKKKMAGTEIVQAKGGQSKSKGKKKKR